MSIPRVIHYCWFGGGPLSEQACKTLESWRRFAPEFKIERWDETNFDISECSFSRGAHAAGKWAFVSDYARFKILYELGGIYMDVGSELVKEIVDLIDKHAPFVGIEDGSFTATSGLIVACEAHDALIGEVLEKYRTIEFENTDDFCTTHTVNYMLTSTLEKCGYERNGKQQRVRGWTFLPPEYFDPAYGFGGYVVTENTYSIHKGSGSWCTPALKIKRRVESKLTPFIGARPAQIIGRTVGEISCNGVRGGVSNLLAVSANVMGRKRTRVSACEQDVPSEVTAVQGCPEAVRIALVLPYFGALPGYFRYWLESAGKNESIDFLIFSDCDFDDYEIPDNVVVYPCRLEDIRKRIEGVVGFRVALRKPYKLCDFKPLYGLVFGKELAGYDYWGHCDPDVIWGDLRKFLRPGLDGGYDRLLSNGHLCLYRNVAHINRFVLTPPANECVTYKDVYRLPGSMAYDESELLAKNLASVGGRQWDDDCFADVDFRVRQFVCTYKGERREAVAFFRWSDGALLGNLPSEHGLSSKEYAYLHLQKRQMETAGVPLAQCVITPTAFLREEEFDRESIAGLLSSDANWESLWAKKVLAIKLKNNVKGFAFLKAKRRLLNRGSK